MAKAYISEYLRQPLDGLSRVIPAGQEPALAVQTVDITASSTQSAAFNSKTTFIAINVDSACHVAFGPNPTVTTDSMRLSADSTMYFGVRPGDKVAIIAGS